MKEKDKISKKANRWQTLFITNDVAVIVTTNEE